jgi:hypothetical protein
MNNEFIARKGAAAHAASHPGGAARFHARRTIMLPAISLHMTATQTDAANDRGQTQPPRAARLTRAATTEKRKFTFRIDAQRHAAFCHVARSRNISRQRLLTEALDALLARLDLTPDAMAPNPTETIKTTLGPESGTRMLPDSCAALRLPL